MSKNEKPNGAPPPADSDDGVSPDDLADMSAEDSPPALAEGGEASVTPGSMFRDGRCRAEGCARRRAVEGTK